MFLFIFQKTLFNAWYFSPIWVPNWVETPYPEKRSRGPRALRLCKLARRACEVFSWDRGLPRSIACGVFEKPAGPAGYILGRSELSRFLNFEFLGPIGRLFFLRTQLRPGSFGILRPCQGRFVGTLLGLLQPAHDHRAFCVCLAALKLGSLAAIARRLCATARWSMQACMARFLNLSLHSCILTGKTRD